MCLCSAALFPRLLWFLRERRFARRENGGCRDRGDGGGNKKEIKLETAARVEEPIAPVDRGDRDEHHASHRSCTQGSDQSESETHAAAELGEPNDSGVRARRLEAHRVEPARRAADPVAAEPSEQLLGSVGRQYRSEHDSHY